MMVPDVPYPFETTPDWAHDHHQFYGIDPRDIPLPSGDETGYTVWSAYLGEDLLQFNNHSRELVLDVGWYPHGSPEGIYRGVLIRFDPSVPGYGWDTPLDIVETRDPQAIIEFVDRHCR